VASSFIPVGVECLDYTPSTKNSMGDVNFVSGRNVLTVKFSQQVKTWHQGLDLE